MNENKRSNWRFTAFWTVFLIVVLFLVAKALGANAQTDPIRHLAIEMNPSDVPDPNTGNWSNSEGSIGGPGEKWTLEGIELVWSLIVEDQGEPRPYDVVNQIGDTSVFNQQGCPRDGREIGHFARYVPSTMTTSEHWTILDKIGWRYISAEDSEHTWHLGPVERWALNELAWCANTTAPNWIVDFDPSASVPYQENPVEPFSGPQYVPGRNWSPEGWEFQLTQVLVDGWDWKWYLEDNVVYQWACPADGGLGFYTLYAPWGLVNDHPEISENTLNEIGYIFVPAYDAKHTFHLPTEEVYLSETKPIWCEVFEPPTPTPSPAFTIHLPLIRNDETVQEPVCPQRIEIRWSGNSQIINLEPAPGPVKGLPVLPAGTKVEFEMVYGSASQSALSQDWYQYLGSGPLWVFQPTSIEGPHPRLGPPYRFAVWDDSRQPTCIASFLLQWDP